MDQGGLPSSVGREALIGVRKKQRPLIRYAGSAAETSIGSKPIGSELNVQFYPWYNPCQVMRQSCSLARLPMAQQRPCLSRLRQK